MSDTDGFGFELVFEMDGREGKLFVLGIFGVEK